MLGLVPEFEELEAAAYSKVSPGEWANLDYNERAKVVALYRCHFLVEAHLDAAVARAADRGNK